VAQLSSRLWRAVPANTKWPEHEAAKDHDDPTTSAIRIAAIRNVCSDAASRVGAERSFALRCKG
jgi:hypothetical protein